MAITDLSSALSTAYKVAQGVGTAINLATNVANTVNSYKNNNSNYSYNPNSISSLAQANKNSNSSSNNYLTRLNTINSYVNALSDAASTLSGSSLLSGLFGGSTSDDSSSDGLNISNTVQGLVNNAISSVRNAGNSYVNSIKTINPNDYYSWKEAALNTQLAQLQNNYTSDVQNYLKTYNANKQIYESQKEDVRKAYNENMSNLYNETYLNNAKLQEMAAQRGIGNSSIGLSLVNSGMVNSANMASYYRSLMNGDLNQIETNLNKIAVDLNIDLDALESKLNNDKVYAINSTEQQFLELVLEIEKFNSSAYNTAAQTAYEALANIIGTGLNSNTSALISQLEQTVKAQEAAMNRAWQSSENQADRDQETSILKLTQDYQSRQNVLNWLNSEIQTNKSLYSDNGQYFSNLVLNTLNR